MDSPQDLPPQMPANPVLRLRPRVPTERLEPFEMFKKPDGPWTPHPEFIDEHFCGSASNVPEIPTDTTMEVHRHVWRGQQDELKRWLKERKRDDINIYSFTSLHRSIDMRRMRGLPDDVIASRIECYYVGAEQ